LILTLISCSKQNKIYYEYDGLVVTRFTDYPKDYFLIGKHQNISDTLNSTFIKSSFSGLIRQWMHILYFDLIKK
jgi:hypothetical protein